MKQLFLGSLLSCMVVGQICGAAHDEGQNERPLPSMLQLCTNALVNGRMEKPKDPNAPTCMDALRSVQVYSNAAYLSSKLPDSITQTPEHEARVEEALRPWLHAHRILDETVSPPLELAGLILGTLSSMIGLGFAGHLAEKCFDNPISKGRAITVYSAVLGLTGFFASLKLGYYNLFEPASKLTCFMRGKVFAFTSTTILVGPLLVHDLFAQNEILKIE